MARFLKMESPQTEAKFGNMVKKFGNTRNFKIGFGPVIGNQFLFQNTQSKQRKLSVIGIIHALFISQLSSKTSLRSTELSSRYFGQFLCGT